MSDLITRIRSLNDHLRLYLHGAVCDSHSDGSQEGREPGIRRGEAELPKAGAIAVRDARFGEGAVRRQLLEVVWNEGYKYGWKLSEVVAFDHPIDHYRKKHEYKII